MTEIQNPDISPAASTAGGLLKAARQAAGVHLAVLSVTLKVPVRQLEALEADQFPADQSPVFARGLVSSMCRQLRIDSAPILALMPMTENYLNLQGAVRHAYPVPPNLGRVRRAHSAAQSKTWWVAAGMVVLIAALIWLPNPAQWAWFESLRVAVTASETASETAAPVALAESAGWSAGGPTAQASAPAMVVTEVTPNLPAGVSETAGTSATSSVPVLAAISSPVAMPSVATPPELAFSAQNMSWIEVRDAEKKLVWNGVLNAGETKRLSVVLPVLVVVGRSDAVQLSVKGQPFDLKPHTQINTARFEVKP